MKQQSQIKLFEGRKIRSTWNDADEQWYFVVEDVVAVLTDSADPKQYVKRLKLRDPELAQGWVQIVPTLAVPTEGGFQQMKVANAKGLLRIIQSIPSKKAEPFKQWLAQVACRGGKVAGVARKAAEEELGHSVISEQNFLDKNPNNLLEGYIPNAIEDNQ